MLTLRNPEELSTFLRRHPGAPRLAREAADRLPAYFPGDPIVLDVEIDPEDAQEPVLFVVVRTGLDPKTALATLNRFDREWWLPARGRTDLPVRVTIEPVCRVRRPRVPEAGRRYAPNQQRRGCCSHGCWPRLLCRLPRWSEIPRIRRQHALARLLGA